MSLFDDALAEVGDGGFLAKVLEIAYYDSTRFKEYARDIQAAKGWNKEDAAHEVIWQAASKMTMQGGIAGLPGGLAGLGAGTADVTSLTYHITEMCGVLAEIYGLDTSDDRVKAFVLAGVSGESNLIEKAFKIVEEIGSGVAREVALKPLVKTLLVPILRALGLRIGVTGGIKIAELIPFVGAVIGAGTNGWMVNDTGHNFLTKLKLISKLI